MDKVQFNAAFAAFLDAVREAETVTRRELGAMSVTLIKGIHGMPGSEVLLGELDYINRLLLILTPMNQKMMVSFFVHFGGYTYDPKEKRFTKKNKAAYAVALEQATQLIACKGVTLRGQTLIPADEPHNCWGWAAHLKVEQPKTFNPEKVTKFVQTQIGLAKEMGIDPAAVLAAVFDGGFSVDDVAHVMEIVAAKQQAAEALKKAAAPEEKKEPAKA